MVTIVDPFLMFGAAEERFYESQQPKRGRRICIDSNKAFQICGRFQVPVMFRELMNTNEHEAYIFNDSLHRFP